MRALVMEVMRRSLETADIQGFERARPALECVYRGGVSLVVTDCAMPGMDGLDFVRAIRDSGNAVPILMVSGSHEVENEALTAGATMYLSKDHVMTKLAACVRTLLR